MLALPVEQVAAAKSHLYLWVPNALLPDGLAVMKAWGFEYKGNILSEMKQYANYLTAFFDAKSLPELVNPLCQKYWELTFSAMEEKYPDAYPAHIFKNIGRLREIKEQICLRDSKSQEE